MPRRPRGWTSRSADVIRVTSSPISSCNSCRTGELSENITTLSSLSHQGNSLILLMTRWQSSAERAVLGLTTRSQRASEYSQRSRVVGHDKSPIRSGSL